jgi:hypothetical protein
MSENKIFNYKVSNDFKNVMKFLLKYPQQIEELASYIELDVAVKYNTYSAIKLAESVDRLKEVINGSK